MPAKDLATIHDCQEILERHISDARTEIRAKLEGLRTEDGNALFAEFDSCLMDHIHDVENDTLDAWAITKKSEIEGGEWGVSSDSTDIEQEIAHRES